MHKKTTTGDWPTSLTKHTRKWENAVNSEINDIREKAQFRVVDLLQEKYKIPLGKAMDLVELPEYEPLINEEMLNIKKERENQEES